MTLIKSISGIRGTIGGRTGEGLTALDTVKYAAAYATWLTDSSREKFPTVVLGRDARISGEMVEKLVSATLSGMGVHVIQLGLATTPTVEMAVPRLGANGGIILTASHNPKQWNALKMLDYRGEFLSAGEGRKIIDLVEMESFPFAGVDHLGVISTNGEMDDYHIGKVLDLPLVDTQAIAKAGFHVVVDAVNSVGGVILPTLLRRLGVKEVTALFCEPTGDFPHNPEPLPEHLSALSGKIRETGADLGFAVDPDVDRLAIVDENGAMFGEEYTLVAVADYILDHTPGNTASNLSSSRALRDVTTGKGGTYFASAVGEVNVVEKMKAHDCIIGGEGNGGVIYPELHYGRDALAGIALFLTGLARRGGACSAWRSELPDYAMVKQKVQLTPETDTDRILEQVAETFEGESINREDGLKVDFIHGWVHLRKSNTEPIIRLYAEASVPAEAEKMAAEIMEIIKRANDQ